MRPLIGTYRLQLTADFGFAAARGILPHLVELGVSHVYLSPCLQAVPGSTHGYDVLDPSRIDAERGGEFEFRRLLESARSHDLGVVLDIVPNHVAADERNPWWRDVLARGERSPHSDWFDIDWAAGGNDRPRQLVLPILGTKLEDEVAAGNVRVVEAPGTAPELAVHDRRLPLDAGSIGNKLHRGPIRELLEAQHYRLEFWRDGLRELNWRRFFDITTLAGIRVELPEVFDAVHRKVLEYCAEGLIEGLRVDHPDGLHDPGGYAERLRRAAPGTWIVFEKILEPGEILPTSWPIDGTTGYDFLEVAGGLFVDPAGEAALVETCRAFTGDCPDFDELLAAKKRLVIDDLFANEARRLARLLVESCRAEDLDADETLARETVAALLVGLPVYRTYVSDAGHVTPQDLAVLETARAAAAGEISDPVLLDVLVGALSGEVEEAPAAELRARFQQLSGPVMAKGQEDTALYCDRRLLAVCEVGCSPAHFGTTAERFHRFCRHRQANWPRSMNCASTHDTKRSEDVRLRIAVLAEYADAWQEQVERVRPLIERLRAAGRPPADSIYSILQTLVGVWPASARRVYAASLKAEREAKLHTSWLEPDEQQEAALGRVVEALVEDDEFVGELEGWLSRLVPVARRHALAFAVLRATAPGVPDLYQGSESWCESLVDPDNRRPVDFDRLRAELARTESLDPAAALAEGDGTVKAWLLQRMMRLRRTRWADLGPAGSYEPVEVRGAGAEAFVAYRRGEGVMVGVPLRDRAHPPAEVDASWTVPDGDWVSWLDGRRVESGDVALAPLLSPLPVVVLVRG